MVRIYKTYKSGDLITASVTNGYEVVATEFFKYCGEHGYNASEVIRKLIYNWLNENKVRASGKAYRSPVSVHVPSSKTEPQDISDEIFKQLIGGEDNGI